LGFCLDDQSRKFAPVCQSLENAFINRVDFMPDFFKLVHTVSFASQWRHESLIVPQVAPV
jgi:hypothetical protein